MIDTFIKRWETSGAKERANYQLFLAELDVGVAAPAVAAEPDEPIAWPDTLAEQISLVRGVIHHTAWQPADGSRALARRFAGVRAPTVQRIVDALAALGHVG